MKMIKLTALLIYTFFLFNFTNAPEIIHLSHSSFQGEGWPHTTPIAREPLSYTGDILPAMRPGNFFEADKN